MSSLVDYSSDSDDEDLPAKIMKKSEDPLPLPDSIKYLFAEDSSQHHDDRSKHQGKLRSFTHVRGNWPTFVFLKILHQDEFILSVKHFCKTVASLLPISRLWPEFHLVCKDELHLSLSRTVPIQHHWIEPLMSKLQSMITKKSSVTMTLSNLAYYCNEEHTRSFIGLEVQHGEREVSSLVDCVDECFKQFGLPIFYEEKSFHVSLLWCLSDILPLLTSEIKKTLQESWDNCLLKYDLDTLLSFTISQVYCKTGNKLYTFNLCE